MSLSSFEFIPLTEELELLPFRCKDEDLNNFLFDDAKHYLAELMAVTYLFSLTLRPSRLLPILAC